MRPDLLTYIPDCRRRRNAPNRLAPRGAFRPASLGNGTESIGYESDALQTVYRSLWRPQNARVLLTEKQASSGGHVEWVSGAKFGYMGKAPPFGPGYMSPRVWHMTEHCRLNAVVKNLEEQVELLERHGRRQVGVEERLLLLRRVHLLNLLL